MSTLSVGGLASGLDTNAIITALVEAKRVPIELLEQQEADLNSKLSAFGTFNDLLESLETTVNSMNSAESFRAKDGSSKDEGVVTVTATGSANTGSFGIVVSQIAKAETFVADGVADQDTTAIASASGTLSFTVGSGSATEISVTASTTLEDLRDAINVLNAGVTASIVNDGSGTDPYRLVLRSDTAGSDGNITFNQNDTDLTFSNTQADQDASITLDGISITSSTNTITDVIDGVSIELVASGTTTFTISNDTDTVISKVNEFVEAYNSVKSFIDEHSSYDPISKEKGVLFGDSTLRMVETWLREVIGSKVSGLSGTYTALSQVGVTTNSDGLLEVDSDDLSDALDADFVAVSRIFIEDIDNGTDGILEQLSGYLDEITNPYDGIIDVREDGLLDNIQDIQDLIDEKEDRLAKYELSLVLKYASLENYLSQSQATADYLTNSLTAMLNQ